MTRGVGGSSAEVELAKLSPRTDYVPITVSERLARIEKAQRLMVEQGIDALYLDASTSLYYFTGLRLWASERLHGAVIPARGDLFYISPGFEEEKTRAMLLLVMMCVPGRSTKTQPRLWVNVSVKSAVRKAYWLWILQHHFLFSMVCGAPCRE